MSAGEDIPSTKTGLARHFDTLTIMGRRNCTLASIGFYFGIFVLYKIMKSKKE